MLSDMINHWRSQPLILIDLGSNAEAGFEEGHTWKKSAIKFHDHVRYSIIPQFANLALCALTHSQQGRRHQHLDWYRLFGAYLC